MPFVILEGADGTGKSTLAKAVADAFRSALPHGDIETYHRGVPSKDVLDEYVTDVFDYSPGIGVVKVADRWHMGERVYAPLYRGTGPYGDLGRAGYRWVEMWLRARGAVLFNVWQPYEVVKQRLADRGEDYLEDKHVKHALDKFSEVCQESSLYGGMLVAPEGDQHSFAANVAAHAFVADVEAQWIGRYPGYIGAPKPTTVLVGDGLFDPKPTPAGKYLLESLPDDLWPDVAIVPTTVDFDKLTDEFRELPRFVAMSRDASDVLLDADIVHAGASHPDTVRHSVRAKTAYGAMVAEVAKTGQVKFSWQNS